ncbi:hypothetical protein H4Q26_001551 [Puccinia striiformis f. sp. tritici PST-130]|nr:hypothetical protein H4Q26_001551 [Puccinia striiformis f. sp. tritici PST-130]
MEQKEQWRHLAAHLDDPLWPPRAAITSDDESADESNAALDTGLRHRSTRATLAHLASESAPGSTIFRGGEAAKSVNVAEDLRIPGGSLNGVTPRSPEEPGGTLGKTTVEDDCIETGYTKSLATVRLRRRGCAGALGTGLIKTSNGLVKAGNGLKYFDTLTAGQKLRLIKTKFTNGVKNTANAAGRGIAFVGRKTKQGIMLVLHGTKKGIIATGRGVFIVVFGTIDLTVRGVWHVLKFIGRAGLRGFRNLGKGLSATGKGLQKVGDRMETSAASRLTKKVSPPPEEPHSYGGIPQHQH